MAGTAGFEPTHDGIKNRCLTAWRRPNINKYAQDISTVKITFSQYFFEKTLGRLKNSCIFAPQLAAGRN